MGVSAKTSLSGYMIGPFALILYAVVPAGVATMTPSPKYELKYFSFKSASICVIEPPFLLTMTASLNAIFFSVLPSFL